MVSHVGAIHESPARRVLSIKNRVPVFEFCSANPVNCRGPVSKTITRTDQSNHSRSLHGPVCGSQVRKKNGSEQLTTLFQGSRFTGGNTFLVLTVNHSGLCKQSQKTLCEKNCPHVRSIGYVHTDIRIGRNPHSHSLCHAPQMR